MLLGAVEVEAILIFEIVLTIVFALSGSFIHDIVRILKKKSNKINLLEIVVSTFFASTIVFGLELRIGGSGFRGLIVPALLFGIMGFQILIRIQTLDGALSLIKTCLGLAKSFVELAESKLKFDEEEQEMEPVVVERKKKVK